MKNTRVDTLDGKFQCIFHWHSNKVHMGNLLGKSKGNIDGELGCY